jgi:hypothetical protein
MFPEFTLRYTVVKEVGSLWIKGFLEEKYRIYFL